MKIITETLTIRTAIRRTPNVWQLPEAFSKTCQRTGASATKSRYYVKLEERQKNKTPGQLKVQPFKAAVTGAAAVPCYTAPCYNALCYTVPYYTFVAAQGVSTPIVWGAAKERKFSSHNPETTLFTTYPYYGNLN